MAEQEAKVFNVLSFLVEKVAIVSVNHPKREGETNGEFSL